MKHTNMRTCFFCVSAARTIRCSSCSCFFYRHTQLLDTCATPRDRKSKLCEKTTPTRAKTRNGMEAARLDIVCDCCDLVFCKPSALKEGTWRDARRRSNLSATPTESGCCQSWRLPPHISTGLHEAIATAMFLSLASRTTWLDTHGTVGTSEPGRPTGLRRLEWRFLFINWCFPRSSRLKYQQGGKEASANTQHRCTTKKKKRVSLVPEASG